MPDGPGGGSAITLFLQLPRIVVDSSVSPLLPLGGLDLENKCAGEGWFLASAYNSWYW